ncbi:MAG TPA: RNA polymerase subunit sigma [Lachnospiraceae bacterium]|nr:RNA polymerase subunit sigma [Lachnospiraceae bacterium]
MGIINRSRDNDRVIAARNDPSLKNTFLSEEQNHILRLTSRILKKGVTYSDDEWSIAFIAVSEAMDSYDPSKGDFWSYASVVIKSRLTDNFRKQQKNSNEISVSPDTFSGEVDEESESLSIQIEVTDRIAVESLGSNNGLKLEIEALSAELSEYDISMSDLYEASPKSVKTRGSCRSVLQAIFLPPPMIDMIRENKKLPIKDIMSRVSVSSKIIDRHRKYLIAASVIIDGDYPLISEYLGNLTG